MESVFTYNFNFVVHLRLSKYHLLTNRPSLRFQAQVLRTLYVRVYEKSIQTYTIGAC
jgi:hypothetical protein